MGITCGDSSIRWRRKLFGMSTILNRSKKARKDAKEVKKEFNRVITKKNGNPAIIMPDEIPKLRDKTSETIGRVNVVLEELKKNENAYKEIGEIKEELLNVREELDDYIDKKCVTQEVLCPQELLLIK